MGYFDGEDMPAPPHDPGVDPDDDQGMQDAEDHQEAGADQRPTPAGALVRGQRLSDARYRMELGDQLISLIVEVGIRPADFKDIEAKDRLSQMWKDMPRDMYNLMWHVVGVMKAFT